MFQVKYTLIDSDPEIDGSKVERLLDAQTEAEAIEEGADLVARLGDVRDVSLHGPGGEIDFASAVKDARAILATLRASLRGG